MASAAKETFSINLTVIETLDPASIPLADSNDNAITHSALNKSGTYDGSSATGLNVKQVAQGSVVMTAGAATINLAGAPGTLGPTSVNMTGQKIRHLLIRAKATNANPITITFGASNGFTGFGAAFSITLAPGKQFIAEGDSTLVASGVRTIDISGTGTQGLDFICTSGDN